eukprot:gene19902-21846_t
MDIQKEDVIMASSNHAERFQDIKAYMNEEMSSSTFHGLPRVFSSSNRIMKLFWLAVFLGLCTVVTQSIHANILLFNQHNVYLQTEFKIHKPMPYPAITICNTNHYIGVSEAGYMTFNVSGMKCNGNVNFSALKTENEVAFHRACNMFLSGVNDTFKLGGKELMDAFPKYFVPSSRNLLCFKFNDTKTTQKDPTMNRGLQMMLYIDPDDYSTYDFKNYSRFDDIRRGLAMIIHDQEIQENMGPEPVINISPGESIDIALKKKIYTRKPAPFPSKCKTNKTSLYKITGRYTWRVCVGACLRDIIRKRCGENTQKTITPKQLKCTENVSKKMPLEGCDCPPACKEIVYHKTISRNKWPTRVHADLLRSDSQLKERLNISANMMTPDYLQQRFAQIRIYFNDFMVEEVTEEELYDRSRLFGDIGGLMGLAIGASVISIIELAWVGAMLVKKLVQKYLISQHAVHDKDMVQQMEKQ